MYYRDKLDRVITWLYFEPKLKVSNFCMLHLGMLSYNSMIDLLRHRRPKEIGN